jgi:LacI family transcriptional regulator
MQNKKTTIYDIAEICKVSAATVSRVLNNSGYPVSKNTKQIVLDAAKSLNYTPNAFGRNLKSQQCKDIGIIVPNISNPYYSALLQGVYDDVIVKGYNIILCNSFRDADCEERNIRMLMQKQVCGIIVISISKDSSAIQSALDFGCKVVLVEQDTDVNCIKVEFNFFKGAYMATKVLIENNHRNIGFIGAPLDRSSRIKMLDGYRQCLADNGITVNEHFIKLSSSEKDDGQVFEISNGKAIADEFCAMENRPTGYICINDMTALGAMAQFQENGLKVPDDVSVIGFDNIPYAEISTPKLTTIDQRAYDMGAVSIKLLMESIESPSSLHYSVRLEPSLVERSSVKKIVS